MINFCENVCTNFVIHAFNHEMVLVCGLVLASLVIGSSHAFHGFPFN